MTGVVRSEAEFLLCQSEDDRARVEVRFEGETAWLSLTQMADLFQRDKSVVSRYIKNVFEEGELDVKATVAKSATVQREALKKALPLWDSLREYLVSGQPTVQQLAGRPGTQTLMRLQVSGPSPTATAGPHKE